MPSLPNISGDEAIAALERLGFIALRQKGSHVVLKRRTSDGVAGCVIPRHRELAQGTLRGALRQAKVEVAAFIAELH